ncbi:MAG: CHAT domain-containing protein [Planctomycetes bacterium]|nr:CHAT domain-containing protein [Planctomycetota bacterium]
MTCPLPVGRCRWLLGVLALAASAAALPAEDARQLYFRALAVERERALAEAQELFEQALSAAADEAAGSARDNEAAVIRRKCLAWLSDHARRHERRRESLEYALRYRRELRALAGDRELDLGRYLRENELKIAEDRAALGEYAEARAALNELLSGRHGELEDFLRLDVLVRLAGVEAETGRNERATALWQEALRRAADLLSRPTTQKYFADRTRCSRLMIVCHTALGDIAAAEDVLDDLLQVLDVRGRRETLLWLASDALTRDDAARAEALLERAVYSAVARTDVRSQAELVELIGETLRRQGKTAAANEALSQAAALYEGLAAESPHGPDGVTRLAAALARLRLLYQRMGRWPQAIAAGERLAALRQDELGAGHPHTTEARMALGGLYGMAGQYTRARPLLEEAVAYWRERTERNAADRRSSLELARALNNLAAVERALGRLDEAERLFREGLDLRRKFLEADDVELAHSYNNLAAVELARGRFRSAIGFYERALEVCKRRGERAAGLASGTLLNLAVAYRSQGQSDRALEYCTQSLELLKAEFGDATPAAAAHYNLLSVLERGRRRYARALELGRQALGICEQNGLAQQPIAAGVHDNLGLICFLDGARQTAEDHWLKALAIYEAGGQATLAARVRNSLGVLAYGRGDAQTARVHFERADELQQAIAARPQDRYNTLCNLAAVERDAGRLPEAIRALERAVELIEAPRAEVSGSEEERAEFFSRTASAFDQLVDLNVASGRAAEAFAAAERGRNRTFLDQLQLAGVDLRSTLSEDAAGRELLARERSLSERIHDIRAQARIISAGEPQPEKLKALAAELQRAEDEFARVWIEIRNRSPLYQRLLTQDRRLLSLDEFREAALGPRDLVLLYYLGKERSYVFVIGREGAPQVVPLEVADELALEMPEAARSLGTGDVRADGERALGEAVKTDKGELVADRPELERLASGPFTRGQAVGLVSWYRTLLDGDRTFGTRGLGEAVPVPKGSRRAEPLMAPAEILLPEAVREIIRERQPELLVIVPDGALHQLPFEALLLAEAPRPEFVLDRFPPIAYAPSANILASLRSRPAVPAEARARVLTVGNPAYPQAESIVLADARGEVTREAMLGVAGQLPLLEGTERETRRIEETMTAAGADVAVLLGASATEGRLAELVRGRGLVHLAAHGLVDERPGNLFGAIALATPDENARTGDDGFLSYAEILQLPLDDCDLAVLSACQTNVGPLRPLEAGATLAQAFLSAGCRRVVASHWKVSDESTAALVGTFFEQLGERGGEDGFVDYAQALHQARLSIRRDAAHPQWAAPYHWAPFVLLGPARSEPAN